MSLILSKTRQLVRARSLLRGTLLRYTPMARGAVLLDTDWMPGPYPKNEEERKAAAKKYNLLPEEYEPLDPKWDVGMGDYPVLPNRCFDDEDPYGDYEYMADARHFGEPVHQAYEIVQAQGLTLNPEYLFPLKDVFLLTGFMFAVAYLYREYLVKFPFVGNMKPLHYPAEGTHYHYPTSRLEFYEAHDESHGDGHH